MLSKEKICFIQSFLICFTMIKVKINLVSIHLGDKSTRVSGGTKNLLSLFRIVQKVISFKLNYANLQ